MQYMARQPILDADEQTAGYEFLYRAAAERVANITDVDTASRSVLEQILLLGCRELSGGNRLFINCSGEVLAREYISVFPPQSIVVEILETVEPTPAIIAACEQLKRSGSMIALDDFVPCPKTLPFLRSLTSSRWISALPTNARARKLWNVIARKRRPWRKKLRPAPSTSPP